MKHKSPACQLKDREACPLGIAIARAIQVARDEKDAVRRVCILLGVWDINIDPSELGAFSQASAFRSGDTPSP